ncbi:MAG: response regulator transcription factor [Burkholderiales bacterium]|nr:response regulator transcription factor [Burkholderiales bacterium]
MSTDQPGTDPPERALRLLIVDDQPLIRRGLAMMLATEAGIDVVGQACDGLDAIVQAQATRPDVVVMDLQMPRASGVVATREITASLPATRVVVLSTYDDDELVFEAIRAGAQAYLLKDASEAEVLDTIRAVHRGESRLSPSIARKVMEQFRSLAARAAPSSTDPSAGRHPEQPTPPWSEQIGPTTGHTSAPDAYAAHTAADGRFTPLRMAGDETLTDKESRILDLIAQGRSNKQIAAAVFLAEGTVKNYVSRIMDKLHAGSRIELAMRAANRRPASY